jgi:hypothetical protein
MTFYLKVKLHPYSRCLSKSLQIFIFFMAKIYNYINRKRLQEGENTKSIRTPQTHKQTRPKKQN